MGTIRFTPGEPAEGLYDHSGYIAQIFDDGSLHGGGRVDEVDRRTVAFRAACECGWQGPTTVDRASDRSAWPEFEDLPDLEAEWLAHTDPFLAALTAEWRIVQVIAEGIGRDQDVASPETLAQHAVAALRTAGLEITERSASSGKAPAAVPTAAVTDDPSQPERGPAGLGPLVAQFTSRDAAEAVGPYELARIFANEPLTSIRASTTGPMEVHQLAVISALAKICAGWVGLYAHRALVAGVVLDEVAAAAGQTRDELEQSWRTWADGQVAVAGRPLLDPATYERIAARFTGEAR